MPKLLKTQDSRKTTKWNEGNRNYSKSMLQFVCFICNGIKVFMAVEKCYKTKTVFWYNI